ncbi:MAG TPA: putative toxin-antitoxin system toxin component, PIN family [Longimicrobium sp.]
MRIVLDTNVLVSALLNPHGAPGAVLQLIYSGEVVVFFDDRILSEYRDVLGRPKLRISRREAEFTVDFIEAEGVRVSAPPLDLDLVDPDDLPFLEIAQASHVDGLVTGNTRHFVGTPVAEAVPVLTPTEFLALWRSRQREH